MATIFLKWYHAQTFPTGYLRKGPDLFMRWRMIVSYLNTLSVYCAMHTCACTRALMSWCTD